MQLPPERQALTPAKERLVARRLRLAGRFDDLSVDQQALALRTLRAAVAAGANLDGLCTILSASVTHPDDFTSSFVVYHAPMRAEPDQEEIRNALVVLRDHGMATPKQVEDANGLESGKVSLLRQDEFRLVGVHPGRGWRKRRGGPGGDLLESVLCLVVALHFRSLVGTRGDGLAARFLSHVAGRSAPSCGDLSNHVEAWRRRIRRADRDPVARQRADAMAAHCRLIPTTERSTTTSQGP